jgi:hypothetical protein
MFKVLIVSFLLFPLFTFSQIAFVELDSKKIPEPAVRDTVIENWNRSQPGYENLPKESKEMLYWTNYARKNPDKFWKEAIVPIIDAFPPLNKAEAKSLQADLTKGRKFANVYPERSFDHYRPIARVRYQRRDGAYRSHFYQWSRLWFTDEENGNQVLCG